MDAGERRQGDKLSPRGEWGVNLGLSDPHGGMTLAEAKRHPKWCDIKASIQVEIDTMIDEFGALERCTADDLPTNAKIFYLTPRCCIKPANSLSPARAKTRLTTRLCPLCARTGRPSRECRTQSLRIYRRASYLHASTILSTWYAGPVSLLRPLF